MKKNFYIFNPQLHSMVGRTFYDFLKNSKIPIKMSFLKKLIEDGELSILIAGDYSSMQRRFSSKYLNSLYIFYETYIFKYIEIYLWLILNKINPFNVKISFNISKIKKDDILLIFSNLILDQEYHVSKNVNILTNIDCKKIVHLSHYIFKTKIISDNCKKMNRMFFIAENNLKKNSRYFNYYFNFYEKRFFNIPYSVRKKFIYKNNFKLRKNKCLSLGSFQLYEKNNPEIKEMTEFYNSDTIHKIRKEIYFSKDKLENYIKCLNEPVINSKTYFKGKYYDFDIVEQLNSYKMFIVGEEYGDLAGISFAEGMKTGSVYLGYKNDIYKDLGMIEGIHYISHNNTLEDIVDKINFYQSNIDKLETISRNGLDLAFEKFNETYVINELKKIINLV